MEDGCRGTTSSRECSTSSEAWESGGGGAAHSVSFGPGAGQQRPWEGLRQEAPEESELGGFQKPCSPSGTPRMLPWPSGTGKLCCSAEGPSRLPAQSSPLGRWTPRQASVGCRPVPCPPQGAQKAAGFCVFPGSAPPCCPGSCLDNESPDLESLSQRDLSRMLTAQDTVLPNKRCERVT